MSVIAQLMEYSGITKVPRYAKENLGYRAVVTQSGEFRRVQALPRRDWKQEVLKYVRPLNAMLKTEVGTMDLHLIQVAALVDIGLYEGAFLPIGVGQGKALISLLAPVVLDAQNPLLIVPAALREQTLQHVIPNMRKHWKLHPNLKVVGYSELSLAKNKDFLLDLKPDVIILDECHYVKNKPAGRTKRMIRYFREYPNTKCIAMSGTIASKSLRDWAHIAEWALGPYTPVPMRWHELSDWADALDVGIPNQSRVSPGALMHFCDPGENARQGFRRRMVETPGVVASEADELGVSLRISSIKNVVLPAGVQSAIDKTKNTWETPNGDIITEAVELWRHLQELSLGFWYRWEPTAPKAWMQARREWKKYVRETLKHNRRGLDTELQVWNECAAAQTLPEWQNWKRLKDTFKINTVAEWLDDFALRQCADWLHKNGGICWVNHRAFGQKLAEHSGLTYYGAGDYSILDTKERAIIASIRAHGEGKNLQQFANNLVVCPPSSGKTWEQLLGRTHREGQGEDTVYCDVFLHTADFEKAFEKAREEAVYLEDTYGNKQKLNYADIV